MTDTNVAGSSLLKKAGQTPMLTGSSFAEESWTDTNSYWVALLLSKAGQTPTLTSSSSVEEGWIYTNAYWEAPLLRKAGQM